MFLLVYLVDREPGFLLFFVVVCASYLLVVNVLSDRMGFITIRASSCRRHYPRFLEIHRC